MGKTGYILGISAFYHDSAAALIHDGAIVCAAQEERFTRKKHDPGFPSNAVTFCLEQAGISIDDLDGVAFYDKPFLKFERLMQTYYGFAPRGLLSFISSIPVWLKEKMLLKKLLRDELKKVMPYQKKKLKLFFPEHHLSHAASAFYASPYKNAAILTIDGVGEWATASILEGRSNQIKLFRELKFPHSLGLLYSAFTYYIGFRVNSGEYKLMGLAPYGNPDSTDTKRFVSLIKTELCDLKPDGSIWLNQQYFNYATGLRMALDKKWEKLFGIARRSGESEINQKYCDLALAIQIVTEECVLNMAREAKRLSGADYLVMAGGVALNCVANGELLRSGIFKDIFIQPAAGDAGGALGAAWAVHYIFHNAERKLISPDAMQGSYLGPEYSDSDVLQMAKSNKAVYEYFNDYKDLAARSAKLLSEGNAFGWIQGRMEWGPRALGNRSIIGDARNPEMQKKLNLKVKFRESFRPFAPIVTEEAVSDFFEFEGKSPYMLLVVDVKKEIRKPLPEGYHNFALRDKLYYQRSTLPAITHLDYSARVQTVSKETNPRFHTLLNEFGALTGSPVLVNTSYNVRGEPIVCTPADAYRCFMRTELDYLVIGNYLFDKKKQPPGPKLPTAEEEFGLD